MSLSDETVEQGKPGADAHRVLTPLELVDIKIAWERANGILPDAISAFRSGDAEQMMDCLGTLVDGLTVIRCTLGLDDVDDDDDDPQAMDTSRWREPSHGD